MKYREARELASLRQRLRERLIADDPDGAREPLLGLRRLAAGDLELRAEYERWAFRFELLDAGRRAGAQLEIDAVRGLVAAAG